MSTVSSSGSTVSFTFSPDISSSTLTSNNSHLAVPSQLVQPKQESKAGCRAPSRLQKPLAPKLVKRTAGPPIIQRDWSQEAEIGLILYLAALHQLRLKSNPPRFASTHSRWKRPFTPKRITEWSPIPRGLRSYSLSQSRNGGRTINWIHTIIKLDQLPWISLQFTTNLPLKIKLQIAHSTSIHNILFKDNSFISTFHGTHQKHSFCHLSRPSFFPPVISLQCIT
ncbi:hypothetical protein H4Q26_013555 [Puccinia striiformis f. sp. tritici PST-130]|nr:hypothetical protein H4Q26_013555 [Puccinia striiformis f. sp. tritici PST-130]